MSENALWPRCEAPSDLADIERRPLADRGLPASTYELLSRAAGLWPDKVAVSVLPDAANWRQPATRTFRQLLGDVHRCANLLRWSGIGRRDAVGLIAPNCAELITATLGAQLAGVAVPINGALTPEHVAQLVKRAGVRVLIAAATELDPHSWQTARRLAADGDIAAVLLLRPTAAEPGPPPSLEGVTVEYLSDAAASCDAVEFAGEAPKSADIAALFHTGGTTGAPKLAAHSHRNEVTDAWMVAANSTFDDDAVLFAALPLFHVNALVVTVLAPLLRGQTVLWAGPLGYRDPDLYAVFWNMVSHYRITTMSAVPTVYAALAHCPVDADVSSMRYAIVGASALPEAVRTEFESRTGITLLEGYGLTEATCASARSFPAHHRHGAVGQRLPYQQIAAFTVLESGDRRQLPPGEPGHLMIKGPNVFAGYVTGRNESGWTLDSCGTVVDGWLDTGDLGHVDADGFVYLRGRAKDLIIRGGHNIDPQTIEDALLTHPAVTAAAAVGRPDVHSGEVPVAYVSVAPGSAVDEQELLSWAREHISEAAAVPKQLTIVDALPVTAVGKPSKVVLRSDAAHSAVRDALEEVAVTQIQVRNDSGATEVIVTVTDPADRSRVHKILDQYTFTHRVLPDA